MDRFGRTTSGRELLRSLRVALLIALALELAYVAGANAFLGFGGLEKLLSSDPRDLTVSFQRPWTLVPGHVHLQRYEMRFEDDHVAFTLAFERAAVDINLAALFSRRLHVTRLAGEGLRLKIATKNDDPEKTKLHPPILAAAPRPKQERAPDDRLWTIDLHGVDSTLRELWIREHRYTGLGRVRGGFRLVPRRRLQVAPANVELRGGELHYGAHETIARAVAGRAKAMLHEHPLSAHEGWQLFSYLDLDGTLEANIASLRAARGYWKDGELDRGRGTFHAYLFVQRGVIRPKSFAEYRTEHLIAAQRTFSLHGDARVRASANHDGGGGTLSMSAERLELLTNGEPAVVATESRLTMTSNTMDIVRPWQLHGASVELPDARAANLGRLSPIVSGRALRLVRGAARARGAARIDATGKLDGKVNLLLQGAELVVAKTVQVNATGRLDVAFEQPRADRASGDVTELALVLDHVRFRTPSGSTQGGWLRVESRKLKYHDGKPTRFDATLRAGFPNAEPVLAALGIQPKGLGRVATAFLDLEDLSVVGRVRYAPTATTVEVTRANTDSLTAHGRWQRRQGRERGAFLLETRLIDAGLLVRDGQTEIEWRVDEPWLTSTLQELRLGESGS